MSSIRKQRIKLLLVLLFAALTSVALSIKQSSPETTLGWKLGVQTWTFKNYTFAEALSKVDSCGLKYVEAFPKQVIGGSIDGTMDYHMDKQTQRRLLELLKTKGIKLISYGVITPDNEADWRTLFTFAKALGIKNITAEPKAKDLQFLSALCDKYKIYIAIHDHPKPAIYWSPDTVLKTIKGYSPRIGACADIGHWVRSGLDPVECLKKLQGHVIELHFKDLNEKSRTGHDVPWGTGISNIPAVIAELKRQHFKGFIAAEYEYNWISNSADVEQSVRNFRKYVIRTPVE